MVWTIWEKLGKFLSRASVIEEMIDNGDNQVLRHMNVAKAFAICLIVLGHSFTETSNSAIRAFVYLFHVPLFFIISGFFFKDHYLRAPKDFVLGRLRRLWIPFLLWSVPFILLHNIFFNLQIYSPEATFRGATVPYYSIADTFVRLAKLIFFQESEQLLGGFWFLPCLFFTAIIFFCFFFISNKLRNSYALPILCVLGFILGNFMFYNKVNFPLIPYDFRLFLITTLLFFIGFLYKKYEHLVPINSYFSLLCLLLLVFVVMIGHYKIDSINSTVGYLPKAILYLVFTPILGTYMTLYLSKIISRYRIADFFDYIGRNTITILALHFLSFKLVSLIIVHSENLNRFEIASFPVIPNHDGWFLAYFLAGVLIPLSVRTTWVKVNNAFCHKT
jgi:fucose 4-O-acetylase-like acetyltransferase